ncbi:MAG TPA: J domain-containing protein [Acidimicrobiales bacterium]|nr:J domain-containing protein [Acidimicrobiales bacterium]
MAQTYYDVLGVARTATADQLRAAYRSRARENHPDAGGDPDQMRQLNAAWRVLRDPARRAAYDRHLAHPHRYGFEPAQGTAADAGAPAAGPTGGPDWSPDVDGLDLTAEEWAELLDTAPMGETMALRGWWAIMPPGTLVAAFVVGAAGVYFTSPPTVALAVGLFVLSLGLFVLAPLRAMARRPDPDERGGRDAR